jgi:hypothetical protein
MKMTIDEMITTVSLCDFPGYTFLVWVDSRDAIYLQGKYEEPDTVTGKVEWQHTRKWLLSPHMTKSELVQTVFKCALTSMEHKTREWFTYRDKAIFGPHFDVDALHRISGVMEKREAVTL